MTHERLYNLSLALKRTEGLALLKPLYNPEIRDPHGYLNEIKAFAAKGGNLIIEPNHLGYGDLPIALLALQKTLDPKFERHTIVPASHWNIHNNPNFKKGLDLMTHLFGVEVFPLIQGYMVKSEENPDGVYTQEEAFANWRAFYKRLKELKGGKKPISLVMFSEGTRSQTNELSKGNEGIILAGSQLIPAIHVPMGIHYERHREPVSIGRGLNTRFGGKPIVEFGKPFAQYAKQDAPHIDDIMYAIADTLPPFMRGIYAQR